MTPEAVLDIVMEAAVLAAKLAAPLLLTALAIGFTISLFQSITQIQEATLAFVPKAIGVAIALIVAGQWMIAETIAFVNTLFERVPQLLSGG